jgi:hypothetical protein
LLEGVLFFSPPVLARLLLAFLPLELPERLLLLLLPLEALPRPLLPLRDGDEPDFEEEEELRDAMACSLGRLDHGRRRSGVTSATRPI